MKLLVIILICGFFGTQGFNIPKKSNFLNILLPNVECRDGGRGGGRFGPPGQFPQENPGQYPQGNQPGFGPPQGTDQQYRQQPYSLG